MFEIRSWEYNWSLTVHGFLLLNVLGPEAIIIIVILKLILLDYGQLLADLFHRGERVDRIGHVPIGLSLLLILVSQALRLIIEISKHALLFSLGIALVQKLMFFVRQDLEVRVPELSHDFCGHFLIYAIGMYACPWAVRTDRHSWGPVPYPLCSCRGGGTQDSAPSKSPPDAPARI